MCSLSVYVIALFGYNKVVCHFCDKERCHAGCSRRVRIVCVVEYAEHETAGRTTGHHHGLEDAGNRQRTTQFGIQVGGNVVNAEDAEERKEETEECLVGHFFVSGRKGRKWSQFWNRRELNSLGIHRPPPSIFP